MRTPDLQIDDYVLGRLTDAAADTFEAALAADRVLQAKVEEAAGLMTRLNRLGSDILAEPLPPSLLRLLDGPA